MVYREALTRLAPVLALRSRAVPKELRRLYGSRLRAHPTHVGPDLRQRAVLREASLSLSLAPERGLRRKVAWLLRDLARPGLRSVLFSKKVATYKEVVRRLKRGLVK